MSYLIPEQVEGPESDIKGFVAAVKKIKDDYLKEKGEAVHENCGNSGMDEKGVAAEQGILVATRKRETRDA